MTYNPGQHFIARSDGRGGVTLTPRFRFKDQMGTFIDPKDNVARSREITDGLLTSGIRAATTAVNAANRVAEQTDDADENGNNTEQLIYTFGPMSAGQTYKFQELESGIIGVVLVGPPDALIGNTINSGGTTSAKSDTNLNQGPTQDRRSAYLAGTLGGEAKQLATMNQVNRRYYGR
jgi:hypothetical protein